MHKAEIQILIENDLGIVAELYQVVCVHESHLFWLFGLVYCQRLQVVAFSHVVIDKLVQLVLLEKPIKKSLRLLS